MKYRGTMQTKWTKAMKEKVVQLNHTERVTDAGSHLWEDYMKTILELYVKSIKRYRVAALKL